MMKHGEGKTHKEAVTKLREWWSAHSKRGFTWNYVIDYTERFIQKNKLRLSNRTNLKHEFDFVVFGEPVKHARMDTYPIGFIEVDGERHDHLINKIKDKINEDFVKDTYPDAFFIRLKKSEVLGAEFKIYLENELGHVL